MDLRVQQQPVVPQATATTIPPREQSQFVRDGNFIGLTTGVMDDVTKFGAKNFTSSYTQAKNLRYVGKAAARFTPLLNVGVGAVDATEAYQFDKLHGDKHYTETTKSVSGTAFNIALSAAGTTAMVALGASALPAVAVGVAGAFVGQAIGEEIGSGLVALRRWWSS